MNCILPVLVELQCNLNDLSALSSCLCLNIEAESNIANCIVTKCNYTELVKVEKVQYELCYAEPEPSRRGNILAVTITLACAAIIFVGLRCWSRYSISRQFWWDDWLLLVSTSFFLGLQAVNMWGVKMGFGLHVWNVNPDLNTRLYQVSNFILIVRTNLGHSNSKYIPSFTHLASTNGFTKSSTSS